MECETQGNKGKQRKTKENKALKRKQQKIITYRRQNRMTNQKDYPRMKLKNVMQMNY